MRNAVPSRLARHSVASMLLLCGTLAQAALRQEWVAAQEISADLPARMGNNLVPHARKAMATDAAGNTYVTGSVQAADGQWDYRTEKFDATGRRVWSVEYDGPARGDDFAHALVLDGNGDLIVTGASAGVDSGFDYATLKYSGATGLPMWNAMPGGAARYNGPGNGADHAYALAIDPAGFVYVAGSSTGTSTGVDFATIKYSLVGGAGLWSGAGIDGGGAARYHRGAADDAFALDLDASGNVVVAGPASGAYATIKYAGATGAPMWSGGAIVDGAAIYDAAFGADIATAVVVDAAGDIFVTGQLRQAGGQAAFATLKYAGATGATLWSGPGIVDGAAIYDGPGSGPDFASDLALDSVGNVIVTGESAGTVDFDYATVKYGGGSGAQLWVVRYNGTLGSSDFAHAVVVDADDNVLVTGESRGADGSLDAATLKYEGATGEPMWLGPGVVSGAVRYAGAPFGRDVGFAIALDGDGGARVAGTHAGPLGSDFGVLSYEAATGAQRWVAVEAPRSYEHLLGAGFGASQGALVVDAAGNTYLTGTLILGGGFGDADFLTQKFDQEGSLVWSVTYDGPASSYDTARAIALDADGNVLVSGTSIGLDDTADFATLKYSGIDGSPMWSGAGIVDGAAHYTGTGYDDFVVAVAVDAEGDVFVTGVSYAEDTEGDFATLKYSGATGATLWSGNGVVDGAARYDHEGRIDEPVALAIDSAGDAVVAGTSGIIGSGADYATIKYSGASGATTWSGGAIVDGAVLYDGPVEGDDVARGLALDAAGNVFVTGESASAPGRGGDGDGTRGASVVHADLATLKYSGASGAPMWSGGAIVGGAARYPSAGRLVAEAIAVDADGDVFVTGTDHYGSSAIATLKYSGASGAASWSGDDVVDGAAIFGRAGGPPSSARALAVDDAGDLVVVGWRGVAEKLDFVTLKYSGDEAGLLAVHYFDGGDGGMDIAQTVAVAPDGSLRVAGDATTLGIGRMTVVALRDAPDTVFSDGFEPLSVPRLQVVVTGDASSTHD